MKVNPILAIALCAASASSIVMFETLLAGQADRYASIRVVAPASEATIFDNNGIVPVEIELSPELDVARNHRIRIGLDGALLSPDRTQPRFRLENLDRGEHWLRVEIVDADGNTLITAPPVKFHVWRASVLFPDKKSRRHPL